MIENLKSKGKDKPYIVDFNPWQWAEEDKISKAFFEEIGVEANKRKNYLDK